MLHILTLEVYMVWLILCAYTTGSCILGGSVLIEL